MAADTKDPASQGQDQDQSGPDDSQTDQEKAYALPQIDFCTFVLSLNSSVLVQLGLIEDPATGQKSKNLPMAKQTIDLLSMLEEKTQGNLSEQEANILKNLLYELRLLYVKEKS
jgi:hypothetical protein